MRNHGFTLIELLVVLAIVGILMGIFGISYLRSVRTAEVREGANQIAADLRSARASAQRQSTPGAFKWGGTGSLTGYTLEIPSGTSTPKTVSLPRGVTLRCVDGCPAARTLTYNAPYGEMTTAINGTRFAVESQTPNIPAVEVRVVGVTGRVMLVGVP